ncbi:MAG: efflux RND transporter permease subunit, partial [Rhizobiaceae bacterium]
AFSPLLFWPGIVGEFMKYMPITLIATLSASMLYSLVFTPTLGAMFAKKPAYEEDHRDGWYMRLVKRAVRFPKTVLVLAVALLVAVPYTYTQIGKGVEFFPNVEPEFGILNVHARGNMSLEEKDAKVRLAEQRILGWPGIKSVYTSVGDVGGQGNELAPDVIGQIQYEFVNWRERKNANEILTDLRVAMAGMPGIDVEVSVPAAGPPTGKAVQVQLSAADPAGIEDAARRVAALLKTDSEIVDIADGLPIPGIDWELKVNRTEAAKYGIGPGSVGTVVQLVTSGLKLSDYRPAGADDAVDIRLRLPEDRRTLATLDQLRVETALGSVPISNFVTREPAPSVGTLNRIDGFRTITVQANVKEGVQAADVQARVRAALSKEDFGAIRWEMVGSDKESEEAGAFLMGALGTAIFLIFVVLLAQFNKFTSVWLVLSSVVMSTIGVYLGLMITGQPFGIVMTGIGVIALAGVVVNNNIVLIETYDTLRHEGKNKLDAILQTCRERARPVLLTALTAIFGVFPIAFGFNLELLSHDTTYGAPSTQWWISLSSAIVFGLAFSTILTLIVTPSALMVFTRENPEQGLIWRIKQMFKRKPKPTKADASEPKSPPANDELPAAAE